MSRTNSKQNGKKEQDLITSRLSTATSQNETRKLSTLRTCKDYLNRPDEDYDKTSSRIKELAQSILAEGLLNPYVIRADGTVVCGGSRLAAQELLVQTKAEGYLTDPDVPVIVIAGSTQDHLVTSIADNRQRQDLSDDDLMTAICRAFDNDVSEQRLRNACNVSATQWARYMAIVRNREQAKPYLDNDEFSLNVMANLIQKAEGHGGQAAVNKLFKSLEPIVDVERKAALEVRRRYAGTKKTPPSSEVVVKNRWPRHLLDSWYASLEERKPIQATAEFVYGATILEQRGVKTLVIPAKSIILNAANYTDVLEVADALEMLVEDLKPVIIQLEAARLLQHGSAGRAARRDAIRARRGTNDVVAQLDAAAKADSERKQADAEAEKERLKAKAAQQKAEADAKAQAEVEADAKAQAELDAKRAAFHANAEAHRAKRRGENIDQAQARIGVEERYPMPDVDSEQALLDELNASDPAELPTAIDEIDFDAVNDDAA